jgi:hypothetical protein
MNTPSVENMKAEYRAHLESPGDWPQDFPILGPRQVQEGLTVWSRSHTIEGRTMGTRRRCASTGCPGWFIGVSWETGQRFDPCSEGWTYDAHSHVVHITGGGEVSARVAGPAPLGTDPSPRTKWPDRTTLHGKGWRIAPG